MNKGEYLHVLHYSMMISSLIEGLDLEAAVIAANRADALGPIVDPTLYREKGKALAEDLQMLEAARSFQADLRRIRKGAQPS